METSLTIIELATKVIKELEKMGYSYNSICGLRATFTRFNTFAEEKAEKFFTEELGHRFLGEKYGCWINYYSEPYPKGAKHAIRAIRLLGDYQLHGVIIRRILKKKKYIRPPQFEEVLTAYEDECTSNEYSLRGMRKIGRAHV